VKPLPYREVKRRLEAAGFSEVSQSGSHVKHKEIAAGTLRSILRQAGLSESEFATL
jgi:predicted RNA binding protein YcfA (HicA-like mRNA interferase family)